MIRFRAAGAADLMEKARQASSPAESVDILRRAVVMADRAEDLEGGFEARRELITTAYHASAPIDQTVAFCWCINVVDAHRGRFDDYALMWSYKWIVEMMIDFTPVPLEIVDRLLDDMADRYRTRGLGSSAVDQLRLALAVKTSRRHRLDELFRAWDENRDLAGADCAACRLHDRVRYHVAAGADEKCLEEAVPLIEGRMSCSDVPHLTFGLLLLPLLRLGRLEEAASIFNRGYPMIRERQGFVITVGQHLMFLGIAGQVDRGLKVLQAHLREGLQERSNYAAIHFFRGAWAVCERGVREGQHTATLSLTPRFELFEADGVYDLVKLRDHFRDRLERLTVPFDRRNGNSAQTELTAEVEGLIGQRLDIPIASR